jgi:hypothetical protein
MPWKICPEAAHGSGCAPGTHGLPPSGEPLVDPPLDPLEVLLVPLLLLPTVVEPALVLELVLAPVLPPPDDEPALVVPALPEVPWLPVDPLEPVALPSGVWPVEQAPRNRKARQSARKRGEVNRSTVAVSPRRETLAKG